MSNVDRLREQAKALIEALIEKLQKLDRKLVGAKEEAQKVLASKRSERDSKNAAATEAENEYNVARKDLEQSKEDAQKKARLPAAACARQRPRGHDVTTAVPGLRGAVSCVIRTALSQHPHEARTQQRPRSAPPPAQRPAAQPVPAQRGTAILMTLCRRAARVCALDSG